MPNVVAVTALYVSSVVAVAAISMPNVVAVAAICKPSEVAVATICMPNVVAVTACPSYGRGGLVNQVVIICCSVVRPKKDYCLGFSCVCLISRPKQIRLGFR